jgi:hypothetical protein
MRYNETEYWKRMEAAITSIVEPVLAASDNPLEYHVSCIEDVRSYPDPQKELGKYLAQQFERATPESRAEVAKRIHAWWADNPAPESW